MKLASAESESQVWVWGHAPLKDSRGERRGSAARKDLHWSFPALRLPRCRY